MPRLQAPSDMVLNRSGHPEPMTRRMRGGSAGIGARERARCPLMVVPGSLAAAHLPCRERRARIFPRNNVWLHERVGAAW